MSELYRPGVKGCTDGNCMLVRNTGMVTNGGCQCESDIRRVPHGFDVIRTVHFLRNQLRDADAELERLRADLARVTAERDDYRERWEQTGCTRHHAMETAIKLNESCREQLESVIRERDQLREVVETVVVIASSDGWDKGVTGRQLVMQKARTALNGEGEG